MNSYPYKGLHPRTFSYSKYVFITYRNAVNVTVGSTGNNCLRDNYVDMKMDPMKTVIEGDGLENGAFKLRALLSKCPFNQFIHD